MRIFITGATGFAGFHLTDALLAQGHQVFGLVHADTSHQPLPDHPLFRPIPGNLLDLAELEAAVAGVQPEVIYHLAGQASPGRSWDNPALTLAINAGGTANLLEAARSAGRPRVVVVTSAEIYGAVRPEELPLTEESEPRPHHPYGVSKWAASQLVRLYWQRYQLPAVEARPFNHIGPRQAPGFVVPDFAGQLAAIKLGRRPPTMSVGNLSAERDFTDVRDVACAYQALAERGRPGETYIICSGRAVSIQHILDALIELSGLDVTITRDPERMRPSETPRLLGSYTKIERDTGWRPEISLRQSLADALADWVQRMSGL
ncbi:MAG: GDP-mannose 4,6-dehydratase [Chloroflexi bacterium]|nr:GDP-mannose 4,6-dehydratase [Chloroflexota bacterium]MCI0577862.1 GDP-mannose 4,6-dehydratase [Chloroflexota bacterium]MCI0644502.1 GDP-mannose 4,6-dehydratase [Chloroflexota bacterium]MCI0730230.1 GDP-mannose 4,6-dehydratase [Chloroflexota bacterium]